MTKKIPKPRYPKRFLASMTPRQFEGLGALADYYELTKSGVIRHLISKALGESGLGVELAEKHGDNLQRKMRRWS